MSEWCPECHTRIVSVTRGMPSMGTCESGHQIDRRYALRRDPEISVVPPYRDQINAAVAAERARIAQAIEVLADRADDDLIPMRGRVGLRAIAALIRIGGAK